MARAIRSMFPPLRASSMPKPPDSKRLVFLFLLHQPSVFTRCNKLGTHCHILSANPKTPWTCNHEKINMNRWELSPVIGWHSAVCIRVICGGVSNHSPSPPIDGSFVIFSNVRGITFITKYSPMHEPSMTTRILSSWLFQPLPQPIHIIDLMDAVDTPLLIP